MCVIFYLHLYIYIHGIKHLNVITIKSLYIGMPFLPLRASKCIAKIEFSVLNRFFSQLFHTPHELILCSHR